jgi:hypothetical protein
MNAARRQTLYFLIAGLVFSVGTPISLALTQPSAAGYLIQPVIFIGASLPYLLGAALWLPSRTRRVSRIGLILSGVLALSSCLLYAAILVGIIPTGGDMIGFGFLVIDAVTTIALIVVTLTAFAILRFRRSKPDEGADL